MFEWWFKYPPELFEQGRVIVSPLPGGGMLWLLLGLAGVLLVASLTARRMRALGAARVTVIGMLQAAFLGGIVILLTRPALEITTLTPGANTIAVLLDRSESMGFPDRDGEHSRLQTAQALLNEALLPELAALGDVVTFTFGGSARREPLQGVVADAPQTRMLASLTDVVAGFSGMPLAAVVVVSDGADNGATVDAPGLVAAGVPVHTIGVGPGELPGEAHIADVMLTAEAPPNSRVMAHLVLQHASRGPALVKVRDGGRLIARREVVLRSDAPVQRLAVDFDSGPGGVRELAFELEPPPGDVLGRNNRVERLLTVRERQHRVLYLEGEPRWEYKFLRRALAGDAGMTLTSWLRTTERKTYRQDVQDPEELSGGFPATLQALYGYDVVLLGSLAATYLEPEQQRWLEAFVGSRGGSLLALAGREALADGGWDVTSLADVLPVQLTRGAEPTYGVVEGRARPTAQGLAAPVTQLLHAEGGDAWGTLPPLADYQRLGALKPAATTLLELVVEGGARPLLVMQPYGLGTSAVLASATTWRWRMRTPPEDDRHTLFWRQLVRQLGESAQRPRELDLEVTDHELSVRLTERDGSFEPRRNVRATASISGPQVDGAAITLASSGSAGHFAGQFRAPQAGVYRVDVRVDDEPPLTRFVRLGAQNPEYFQPAQNEALLRRVAADTGGRYWPAADVGGLVQALTLQSAGVRERERLPLWDMPFLFALLLLVKGSEWLLRRRWGRI